MFEFDFFDERERQRFFNGDEVFGNVRRDESFSKTIKRASIQFWGEHCIECAVPVCYSSCDLYMERPDGKCRTFVYGIHRRPGANMVFPNSAEVVLRPMSHFYSPGSEIQFPISIVHFVDKANYFLTPLINRLSRFFSPAIDRLTGRRRFVNRLFCYLRYEMVKRTVLLRNILPKPEHFLMEIYNPNKFDVEVHVKITGHLSGKTKRHFEQADVLVPGFKRWMIPYSDISAVIGDDTVAGVSISTIRDAPTPLLIGMAHFVTNYSLKKHTKTRVENNEQVKCLVWDLDNTLWKGILVESDGEPPQLREGVRKVITALDERGILMSIASKNNYDLAWKVLEHHGLSNYFLAPQINWDPKSLSIKRIALELNIGIDSLALVDDSEFEREEVCSGIPQVRVYEADEIDSLLKHTEFTGHRTDEARKRRSFYQESAVRKHHEEEFSGGYVDFLRSCNIELIISEPEDSDWERIYELIQRTNQLNFSGHQYKRNEFESIMTDSEYGKFAMRCRDKFGKYGIIGFCLTVANGDEIVVKDFMLSCRVQSKKVEHSALTTLARKFKYDGFKQFTVEYNRTERNMPAAGVFKELNFHYDPTRGFPKLDLSRGELEEIDYIDVKMIHE